MITIRKKTRWVQAITGLLAYVLLMPTAWSAALYWDANGNGTDSTYGGSGTWDTAGTVWNTSATIGSGALQAWNNSTLDDAIFLRGTTGSVTVSGTVIVKSLGLGGSAGSSTTGTTAYSFSGGPIDIRIASFSNAINVSNGTFTVDNDIYLYGGTSAGSNRQRLVDTSGSLTLKNIVDISGVTGAHSISLEAYSTGIAVNGNITKSTSSPTLSLEIGGAGTANSSIYTLGGDNTDVSTINLNKGILVLNNNNALAGVTALSVLNANTTSTGDTANVLIGTGGVTINKAVTFAALTSADINDVRTIGGSNTSGTSTFSNTITLGAFAPSGTGSRLNVTAAAGGTTVFSGNITDGTNSVGITKIGTGTVNFSRAAGMNYDGGTLVSAGTLLVNNTSGSGTGSGAVNVSAGATLGGSGIIAGATTISGTLSPGNSPGLLSFGSTLALNTGSSTQIEIGASTTRGTTFDGVDVTGALTYGGDLVFTLSGTYASDTWNVFDFGGESGNFDSVTLAGSYAGSLSRTGDLWSGVVGGQSFEFNQLDGTLSAVPEPSAYALLGVGLGAFWFLRRKKAKV